MKTMHRRRRAPKAKAIAEIKSGILAAVSAAPADTVEPRAFRILDRVPPGHSLFRVDGSGRFEPHLHEGEWVVVDATSEGRAIVFGELYVVLQCAGPMLWQVNRERRFTIMGENEACAALSPLNHGNWQSGINLSDGPVPLRVLSEQILGRVVGMFVGPRPFCEKLYKIRNGGTSS